MIRQRRNDNGDEDAVGAKVEVRKTWHAECVFNIAIKEPLLQRRAAGCNNSATLHAVFLCSSPPCSFSFYDLLSCMHSFELP